MQKPNKRNHLSPREIREIAEKNYKKNESKILFDELNKITQEQFDNIIIDKDGFPDKEIYGETFISIYNKGYNDGANETRDWYI